MQPKTDLISRGKKTRENSVLTFQTALAQPLFDQCGAGFLGGEWRPIGA